MVHITEVGDFGYLKASYGLDGLQCIKVVLLWVYALPNSKLVGKSNKHQYIQLKGQNLELASFSLPDWDHLHIAKLILQVRK